MKLRWKTFIVLFCAGVLPLGLFVFFSANSTSKAIDAISSATKEKVSQEIEHSILRSAATFAMLLQQTRRGLEYAVLDLAQEASHTLDASKNVEDIPQAPYYPNDFTDPGRAPAGLDKLPGYAVHNDSQSKNLLVSMQHPVVFLPGNSSGINMKLAAELQCLTPALRQLRDVFGKVVLWVNIMLRDGPSLSFPGHALNEQSIDPNKAYELARLNPWRKLNWSMPVMDPQTRQVVLKVSRAFVTENTGKEGAVSVDARLESVFRIEDINESWINFVHCFFVSIPLDKPDELIIQAERFAGPRQLWIKPAKRKVLKSEDQEAFGEFMQKIRHNTAGSANMPYNGVSSIWAYAKFDQDTRLVFIAPGSVAFSLPNRVDSIFRQFTSAQRYSILFSSVLALALALGTAFVVARTFDRHLRIIVDAWRRLAAGDFNVRIRLPYYNDERGQLFESFNETVPRLAESVRMSQDLSLAQQVQHQLMPHHVPELPGIDLDGLSFSCVETGGDYYDYFMRNEIEETPGNKLAVVVGDVSGHGAGPAMLMVTARAFVRQRARHKGTPVEVVADVNRLLSHDVRDSGQFMTLFFLELDPDSLDFTWVRAGHEPAFLYDTATDSFEELGGRGISLGIIGSYRYRELHGRLKPGQIVIIGTDGIWEARNSQKNMYGKERFKECIRKHAHSTSRDIIHAVLVELETFTGSLDFEDDVTMVVLKVQPDQGTN